MKSLEGRRMSTAPLEPFWGATRQLYSDGIRRLDIRATLWPMCRNIRTLYNFDPPATPEEIDAAALQFVRKISGFTKPSQVNQEPFDRAVREVAAVSARLLSELQTSAPAKDREREAARARAAAARRFAA